MQFDNTKAALLVITLFLPALAQETFQGQAVSPHEVLVKYKSGQTSVGLTNSISVHNIDQVSGVGGTEALRLRSRTRSVADMLSELRANPTVLYAEPNYILRTNIVPNDSNFGQLWGLRNVGQSVLGTPGTAGADIRAIRSWDVTAGNRDQVIGVVDTGLDYNHHDLTDNIWSAPSSFSVTIGGTTLTCPAGSHGFNAINGTCDPMDDNNHGTHVSGTIGARGNNSTGVVGINWTTSIMALKFMDSSGSGTTANAISVIEFAIQVKRRFGAQANVRVLSNSWGGGGFSQALLDEINRANSADMLFVAAAGNSASNNELVPTYPASYDAPNIISVAATTNADVLASFSNFGVTHVHLAAPGVGILSTVRLGNYAYLDGTSMATPHVSGAAMLVLSACKLDTSQLKATILSNVDAIPNLGSRTSTGGRLNVDRALRSCSSANYGSWADVNSDRKADYCRTIGGTNLADSRVGCTLSTGTNVGTTIVSSVLDWGYNEGRAWVDVNGDGKADFCRLVGGENNVNSHIACTLSTGNAFGATFISGVLDWGYSEGRTWVDVNGDGKADFCRLVGVDNNVNSHIACTISTGTGFGVTIVSSVLDWGYDEGRAWVDVNGDGKADFCRLVGGENNVNSHIACTLSTGNAFGATFISGVLDWGYSEGRTWVDVNGDGKADFCRLVGVDNNVNSHIACTLSTGTGFGATIVSSVLDWGYDEGRAWVDVNGDGRADFCRLVGVDNNVNSHIACTLSTGNAFGSTFISGVLDWGYSEGRAWVDVNGDGKADFCRSGGVAGDAHILCTLSTGNGFGPTFVSGPIAASMSPPK